MTVPTPSVGQVIDAAAWGAVVATDVNGLLADVTTLEGQMSPLQAGLIGVRAEVAPALGAVALNTPGAWTVIGSLNVPAVDYPRIAHVSAAVVLTSSGGTATTYYCGLTATGFAGTDHLSIGPLGQSAHVSGTYTLAASTFGLLQVRVSPANGTATASTAVGAGWNYLHATLVGVRAIGATI